MPQVRNPAHSSRLAEPFRFFAQRDGRRPGPLPFPPRAGAGRLASGTVTERCTAGWSSLAQMLYAGCDLPTEAMSVLTAGVVP